MSEEIEVGSKVICHDATGYHMDHLQKGKKYTVQDIDGVNVRLVGVLYSTKLWRFKLVAPHNQQQGE